MKKKKIKNIFYIYGNNIIKKNKYKKYIKKKIQKKYNKIIIINLIVDKNLNFKYIYEKIFFQNFFYKKRIIILNIIEKINNLNKLIIKNIIHKFYIKKTTNIFIIFIIEFTNFLLKKEINKFKKYNFVKLIKCKQKKKEIEYEITKNKYENNKIIKLWIKSIKKKNIYKNIYILKKIQKNNLNKLIILNILFKFIIKNVNKFNKKNFLNILKLIKKYDINIKKNININWINFNIISWYIIKRINN